MCKSPDFNIVIFTELIYLSKTFDFVVYLKVIFLFFMLKSQLNQF